MFSIILLRTESIDLNSSKINDTESSFGLTNRATKHQLCAITCGQSHTHTLQIQCAFKLTGVRCTTAHLGP